TDSWNQCGKWDAVKTGAERPRDPYMKHLYDTGFAKAHLDDYGTRPHRAGEGDLNEFVRASFLPREHYTDDFTGRNALNLLEKWPADPAGNAPWCLWVN